MAISWPFDSTITQDEHGNPLYSRAYSSDVLARFFSRYFRNGVFAQDGTGLQVIANEGMTVLVRPGAANLNGRQFLEESDRVLAVQAANAALDRIDTVVLRLNLAMEALTIDLYVVPGEPAATPAAPALTRNAGIWELGLADLFIAKGTNTITQQRITDTRLNPERCGLVASIIGDTDTAAFYAQVQADLAAFQTNEQASFAAWFATVQNTLSTDAAGNLYTLLSGKVNVGAIVNNLTAGGAAVPLSAQMGKVLSEALQQRTTRTLLWENPAPAASFAAQTVGVDLAAYQGVVVAFLQRVGEQTVLESAFLPKGTVGKLGGYRYRHIAMRTVTAVSDTGVTFGGAGYASTYGGDLTPQDDCILPWRIYGVAGVQL